ncbi:hypothetical protein [Sporosalibacterium faouarense]|uniref:hypothetical protein n=1 Tax=Sporosalibacterium faouarense TaxID=516123 RepID=UPI00141C110B|nr:hypothetical protein [Sporosalibacterium faouarense]MTI48687.1 hypothetical protein [Bacillota bacterium]
MHMILNIIDSLGGSLLAGFIVIIGIVLILKLAKEVIGFVIKIGFIVAVLYLLFNYTGLFYYIQGMLNSLDIL